MSGLKSPLISVKCGSIFLGCQLEKGQPGHRAGVPLQQLWRADLAKGRQGSDCDDDGGRSLSQAELFLQVVDIGATVEESGVAANISENAWFGFQFADDHSMQARPNRIICQSQLQIMFLDFPGTLTVPLN